MVFPETLNSGRDEIENARNKKNGKIDVRVWNRDDGEPRETELTGGFV